jgi:hypothetical protein
MVNACRCVESPELLRSRQKKGGKRRALEAGASLGTAFRKRMSSSAEVVQLKLRRAKREYT